MQRWFPRLVHALRNLSAGPALHLDTQSCAPCCPQHTKFQTCSRSCACTLIVANPPDIQPCAAIQEVHVKRDFSVTLQERMQLVAIATPLSQRRQSKALLWCQLASPVERHWAQQKGAQLVPQQRPLAQACPYRQPAHHAQFQVHMLLCQHPCCLQRLT